MQLTIAILGFLVATAAATPLSPAIRTDLSLANYLLKQQPQTFAADPAVSVQCFSLYLPLLNNVANQWSTDYANCLSSANTERDAIMQQMQEEMDAISASASEVCQSVNTCQSINETLDFFNCFADLGTNVISTVYTISNNASDDAATMLQELEIVDANMYKCTNASERTYVEQTSKIYDALDDCLQNGLPTVVETTTTTAAPSDSTDVPPAETTTAPPTETTAAPPAESTSTEGTSTTVEPTSTEWTSTTAESTSTDDTSTTSEDSSTTSTTAEVTTTDSSSAAPPTDSSTVAADVEKMPEEDLSLNKLLKSILARVERNQKA